MKVFDYDGAFMRFALLLSRLTIINILWLVCCIPIITIGAATAGQYYAISLLMNGNTSVFKNFKAGIKLHWKRASIIWIVLAVLSAAFLMEYYILMTALIPGKQVLVSISVLAFLTLLMVMLWIYPVMINFTGNLSEIIFNSFVFTFMYAPITIIAGAIYGAMGFLLIRFILTRGLCILFGQSLVVYLILTLFSKVFNKYKKTDKG